MGRRSGDKVQAGPQGRWLTSARIIPTVEVLPREQGVQAPHGAPHPLGSVLGRWDPRIFGFEGQWGLFQESQGYGKEILLLNGAHKISYTPGLRAEAVIWKKLESDSLADLREPPREEEDNWDSSWGQRHW